MLTTSPTTAAANSVDDCTICLNALGPGVPLLTLSCSHKFHLQCLASNIKANNKECPLCRAPVDTSVIHLLANSPQQPMQLQRSLISNHRSIPIFIQPSVEDPIDEAAIQELYNQRKAARQAADASLGTADEFPKITVSTTLEYGAQPSHEESNIYGLITLQTPVTTSSDASESIFSSRAPIDLICVVDQSSSMMGDKMTLLKQTLIHIIQQMNEFDRLALVSFNTNAFDRSHGLKRVNEQNKQTLIDAISHDIHSNGGTYIGSGLRMGIDLFSNRRTKNPIGALFLLTDGQDNDSHDYASLVETLPDNVSCYTFGYGPDHEASLLVRIAELGNNGSFTYIDEVDAVGSAFGIALGGLFTCIAQQLDINIELNGDYKITHFNSKYKYEPAQLPSTKLKIRLNDLNAEEKRNLVFQLHIPKININEQNVDISSQEAMSLSQGSDEIRLSENKVIGTVTVTYLEPNTDNRIEIDPINFELVRASHPSSDLLKVNYTLDIQRNRIETAIALERAMAELDYRKSRDILKTQIDKIKASASAQDPFCQQLIGDLGYRYTSERAYRSSQNNNLRCQYMERGTYITPTNVSAQSYINRPQHMMAFNFQSKNE